MIETNADLMINKIIDMLVEAHETVVEQMKINPDAIEALYSDSTIKEN